MSTPQQPWSHGQPRPGQPPYGAPQGYAQPPQGYGGAPGRPPAPHGGGPTGELVINLMKPFGAMGMISPVVVVDGHPAACSWGRNAFPAPAGVRQVDVAQTYLWTYGRASLPVTVEPGRTSEVFYAGPLATFGLPGAIGTEPQKRPGRGVFVVLMSVVVLALLVAVLAAVVGNS